MNGRFNVGGAGSGGDVVLEFNTIVGGTVSEVADHVMNGFIVKIDIGVVRIVKIRQGMRPFDLLEDFAMKDGDFDFGLIVGW